MKKWQKRLASIGAVSMMAITAGVGLYSNAHRTASASTDGTVTYNRDDMHTVSGPGIPDDNAVPLYVNGTLAFCLEPGVLIDDTTTPGYVGNPQDIPRRAMLAMNLWQKTYGSATVQDINSAQLVVWQNLTGVNQRNYTHMDGMSDSTLAAKKKKLNDAITNYDKKPSFNSKTYNLVLNKPYTIKNTTAGVNLKDFDKQVTTIPGLKVTKTADSLTVTATDPKQTSGKLAYKKSFNEGTPYVWKKDGSQQVATGGISDPNNFLVNFKIDTTGDVKVAKTDEKTGKAIPGTKFDLSYKDVDGKDVTKSLTTGTDGTATLKDVINGAKVTVTETFVPSPYVLASALGGSDTKSVTVTAAETASVAFKNTAAVGESTIIKKDATTDKADPLNPNYGMQGAVYGWFKSDGTLVKSFTMTDDLAAKISDQPLGSYYWQEITAPVGYTLDPEKHNVELKYADQSTPVVVENAESKDDVIRMNLDGQKMIQTETAEMFKDGVEFTATDVRTGDETKVTTATVDGKAGYFAFKDLPLDDYVIKETKGVEGYKNIDPIEVDHTYNKDDNTFTFVVKDQKTGTTINTITATQDELQNGENVNLGTYTLKDKIEVAPEVGISTQAHTGDGKSQTFVWGDDVKFYDDVNLHQKNVPNGTVRGYETKLVAVYEDGTEKVVWKSGIVDYTVTDEDMTNRVIAEYDYKKDPKANDKTRWYFKEDGYKKDDDGGNSKDIDHNPKGDDAKQTITPTPQPVTPQPVTPQPVTPVTPDTPKTEKPVFNNLPYTGTDISNFAAIGATVVAIALAGLGITYYVRKRNK